MTGSRVGKGNPNSATLRASPLLHLHRQIAWTTAGTKQRRYFRKQKPTWQTESKDQSEDGKVGCHHITKPLPFLAQQLTAVISKQLLKTGAHARLTLLPNGGTVTQLHKYTSHNKVVRKLDSR